MSEYKIVNLQYTEQASILVRADTIEEAEKAILEQFPDIPDIKILSIEDAPDDVVASVVAQKAAREKVTLN